MKGGIVKHYCVKCSLYEVHPKRWELGYRDCLSCGDKVAKQRVFPVACGNKSSYQLVTREWLKQLNPKITT